MPLFLGATDTHTHIHIQQHTHAKSNNKYGITAAVEPRAESEQ